MLPLFKNANAYIQNFHFIVHCNQVIQFIPVLTAALSTAGVKNSQILKAMKFLASSQILDLVPYRI